MSSPTSPAGPRSAAAFSPHVLAAWVGLCAGWGVEAFRRIVSERLLIGVLVPMFLFVPLVALAVGPLLGERSRWTRPLTLAAALSVLCATVADAAHVFYAPLRDLYPGVSYQPNHRYGIGLLVFLACSVVPFAALGRRLGEILEDSESPAKTASFEALGLAVGVGGAYLTAMWLGAYDSFFAFAALVTLLLSMRWLLVVVVASAALGSGWAHVKPHLPLTWAVAEHRSLATAWSANQKLDGLALGSCAGFAFNDVLLSESCADPERSHPDLLHLVAQIGKRLEIRNVIHLDTASMLSPAVLSAALPERRRYHAVELERRVLDWSTRGFAVPLTGAPAPDPRVTEVADDSRRFLETSDAQADLLLVLGVDTPFVTVQGLPISRAAWLFTSEGYGALLARTSPRGVVLVEAGGDAPASLERLLAAAPPELRVTLARYQSETLPTVGMKRFWVAFTRSADGERAIRDAFGAVPGFEPMDPPDRVNRRVASDDRPIVFASEGLFVAETVLPLSLLALVAWSKRRALSALSSTGGPTLILAGVASSMIQLATVTSFARGYVSPASATVALLMVARTSEALACGLVAASGRPRLSSTIGALGASTVVALSALAGSAIVLAMGSPFVNHVWAVPAVAAAAWPSAWVWATALSRRAPPERRRALGLNRMGAVLGLTATPALIALDGLSFVALAGGVLSAMAAWRIWMPTPPDPG